MMDKREVKRQLRKIERLITEHNKKKQWRTHPFENGLFMGAYLAYDSVLSGEEA
jgi:hypothetical protein